MRLLARTAPLPCIDTLSFAFGFEDNMWSWGMQAFTNKQMLVCDDEQRADKRARATAKRSTINEYAYMHWPNTRFRSHTKQLGGAPVAACIHNSSGHNASIARFICFTPEVIFHSRVIGACPVTTDCIVAMSWCEINRPCLTQAF